MPPTEYHHWWLLPCCCHGDKRQGSPSFQNAHSKLLSENQGSREIGTLVAQMDSAATIGPHLLARGAGAVHEPQGKKMGINITSHASAMPSEH